MTTKSEKMTMTLELLNGMLESKNGISIELVTPDTLDMILTCGHGKNDYSIECRVIQDFAELKGYMVRVANIDFGIMVDNISNQYLTVCYYKRLNKFILEIDYTRSAF